MHRQPSFIRVLVSAFGVTVVTQLIAFFRQVLIAAYFGISRGLDEYFMTFAIATIVVFTFASIFDTVGIPHLVRLREEEGDVAFRKLTGSIFSFSCLLGIFVGAVFILVTPPLAIVMAAGFSVAEQAEVASMAWDFLPWMLIMLPYYALCSLYKSIRFFSRVFLSEVVVAVISTLVIVLHHDTPSSLPIAYFVGYAAAFVGLFLGSFRHFNRLGSIAAAEMKVVYRNFLELFGANQIGALGTVVDRFFQSFLAPGGISALSYATQLGNSAASVLNFREIFIVPLSSVANREAKLERAVVGLTVLTIPVMVFLASFAPEIMTVLFKRGKFGETAVYTSSAIFSVYALTLLSSVALAPMLRMFQVLDRIRWTALLYLCSLPVIASCGALFVFQLKLDAVGLAWMLVVNSYFMTGMTIYLLRKLGLRLNVVRLSKYAGYSVLAALLSLFVTKQLPFSELPLFISLTISGLVYFFTVSLAHIPLRHRLARVISES